MRYKIAFDRPAERAFRRLPADVQQALARRLSALADDIHPPDSRKLQGTSNCYRLRHGDYRLVYTILEDQIVVLVMRVGHRSEVYRDIHSLTQAIRKRKRQNQ